MFVFDLDQTVVDSSHRTPYIQGKVDVVKYVSLQTKENIYKDKILPIAKVMQEKFQNSFVVICTARLMTQADYEFLYDNNLQYHEIYERGNVAEQISTLKDGEYKMQCLKKYKNVQYTFYDDSEEVIEKFKAYKNVVMIDAKIENEKLR
ncbi:MAG: hypothetical protein CMB20_004640 [Methanobacteriota archaeon]|nr:MAG: hypothetical protein CMB20_004640 [Euryarchaeota archaeon]|tara:strand:+ start:225 stop:671 length:447 start_codon:yes stop_codon:yes gene_type:complete